MLCFSVIAEYNRQKDLEDQKENSQQEILTLQQLLQETCDEATLANNEISRLTDVNERCRHEVVTLKETLVSLSICLEYVFYFIHAFAGFQQEFRIDIGSEDLS